MGAILAALAPTVLPLLITEAERLFGRHKGSTKLDSVVKAALAIAQNLATSGVFGGPAPTADELAAKVSEIAGKLFPPGTTIGTAPAPATPTAPAATEANAVLNLTCPQCSTVLGQARVKL